MKKTEYRLENDRIVKIIDGLDMASTNYDKIADIVDYLNEQADLLYKASKEAEKILSSAKTLIKHLCT